MTFTFKKSKGQTEIFVEFDYTESEDTLIHFGSLMEGSDVIVPKKDSYYYRHGKDFIKLSSRLKENKFKISSVVYVELVCLQTLNNKLLEEKEVSIRQDSEMVCALWHQYIIEVCGIDLYYKFNFEDLADKPIHKIKKLNKKLMKHMVKINKLLNKDVAESEYKFTINEIKTL